MAARRFEEQAKMNIKELSAGEEARSASKESIRFLILLCAPDAAGF
jgi:hypothetical protein